MMEDWLAIETTENFYVAAGVVIMIYNSVLLTLMAWMMKETRDEGRRIQRAKSITWFRPQKRPDLNAWTGSEDDESPARRDVPRKWYQV